MADEIEFPPGIPDEYKSFIKRQIERNAMEQDDYHLRLRHFFNDLSVDNLTLFSTLMARAQLHPTFAAYMEGMADATLETKHGICPGCGKNHDPNMDALDLTDVPDFLEDEDGNLTINHEGIVNGDRVASCSVCHGDRTFDVCQHPLGSHGQVGTGMFCPEPLKVPCYECSPPQWLQDKGLEPSLDDCPRTICHGSLLPMETPDRQVCSECGSEYPWEAA